MAVAKEKRIILKYADAKGYSNDLPCYLEHGGYDMLKKAVKSKKSTKAKSKSSTAG